MAHKNQKKWDEYTEKWSWEQAYKKWFMLRFILLLIALGLAIVLAFIYFYAIPFKEQQYAYIQLNVLPRSNTDQNRVIDTSTWKTYSNALYGFEIKYPAEFTNILDISFDTNKARREIAAAYPISGSINGYVAKMMDSTTMRTAMISTDAYDVYLSLHLQDTNQAAYYKKEFQQMLLTFTLKK